MFGVGDAFKQSIGGAMYGNGDFRAVEIRRKAGVVAFAGFAEQNSANGRGGTQGFFNQARAFDADRAVFTWQAATECDTEFLEPTIFATGDDAARSGSSG